MYMHLCLCVVCVCGWVGGCVEVWGVCCVCVRTRMHVCMLVCVYVCV